MCFTCKLCEIFVDAVLTDDEKGSLQVKTHTLATGPLLGFSFNFGLY